MAVAHWPSPIAPRGPARYHAGAMRKLFSLLLLLAVGAGVFFSARFVDRMAVGYLGGEDP
jgi:hypothetical protein